MCSALFLMICICRDHAEWLVDVLLPQGQHYYSSGRKLNNNPGITWTLSQTHSQTKQRFWLCMHNFSLVSEMINYKTVFFHEPPAHLFYINNQHIKLWPDSQICFTSEFSYGIPTYNIPDIQHELAQISILAEEWHFNNNILYCFTQTAEISAICQKKVSSI